MDDALEALRQNAAGRSALLADRDVLIVAARAAGATVVSIAEAAGLTRQQVHRILEQKKES